MVPKTAPNSSKKAVLGGAVLLAAAASLTYVSSWDVAYSTASKVYGEQPQHCVGDWTAWDQCDAMCGGGHKSRRYQITKEAGVGGDACEEENHAEEHEACNDEPCEMVGLVLEVWENVHGKKGNWHDDDGGLIHTQPGGVAKDEHGDFVLQPEVEDVTPSKACKLTSFAAPVDSVADGGERISGFFTPPETSEYTFSLSADDGAKLYFGESARDAAPIAQVVRYLGRPGKENGDSTAESTQVFFDDALEMEIGAVSQPILLTGGTKYHISAVEVNRQGRDALSVSVAGGPWSIDSPVPIPEFHDGVTVLSHSNEAGDLEECWAPSLVTL
eukprot:SAG11_NODE_664_length_7866_cov_6.323291_6_plen_329_part_00